MVKTASKKLQPWTNNGWWEKVYKWKHPVDSAENLFKVPVKQWKKWWVLGRRMFNEIYQIMGFNCELFLHPDVSMKVFSPKTRHTTARNAARMAADSAEGIVDEMMG